jgi:hypothetical protein
MINLAKGGGRNNSVKASRPLKRVGEISGENLLNKKLKVASEDSDGSGENGSLGGDGYDVPGSRMEPETRTKLHEMSDDEEDGNVRDQEVKTEIGESCVDVSNAAAQTGDPNTVAQTGDPNTAAQTGDPSTVAQTGDPSTRVTGNKQKLRCMYGAKCYRSEHKYYVIGMNNEKLADLFFLTVTLHIGPAE